MISGQIWRRVCILAILAIIPGLARAGPSEPRAAANPLLRTVADGQRGAGLFQRNCGTCHSVEAAGATKFGPNLHGLFGRGAGTLPGYNYSAAMRAAGIVSAARAAGIVWDAQTLDSYLANPHKDIPGGKMPFAGLPGKADRDEIIAYLQQSTR